MAWREEVPKKICATMRYCFRNPVDGQFPNVIEDEWSGHDNAPGVEGYIVSLIYDEIKKAFKAGYEKAYVTDFLNDPDIEKLKTEAKHYAEKTFNEWDSE